MTVFYTCRSSQAAFLLRKLKFPGKWFVCIRGCRYMYWQPLEDLKIFRHLLNLLKNGIPVAALH